MGQSHFDFSLCMLKNSLLEYVVPLTTQRQHSLYYRLVERLLFWKRLNLVRQEEFIYLWSVSAGVLLVVVLCGVVTIILLRLSN